MMGLFGNFRFPNSPYIARNGDAEKRKAFLKKCAEHLAELLQKVDSLVLQ